MSDLDRLIEACSIFSKKLENLRVGVCRYENDKPIEEKILILEEINKMLTQQLRTVKLNAAHKAQKGGNMDLDVTEECQRILKVVLQLELQEKKANTAQLGQTLNSILTNDEPKMQTFKQKLQEQLEYLETTSNTIQKLHKEQIQVLEESMELRKEILVTQLEYQEKLRTEKERIAEEQNNKSNSAYNEQLSIIQQRVSKINFMSTIISRVLIFGQIEENEELEELIEKSRTLCTLESLCKNNDVSY